MKDKSINHISEKDPSTCMQLISNDDDTITLFLTTHFLVEPTQEITFTKEGIKELIEDLQNLIK